MSSFRFRLARVQGVRAIEEETARALWQEAQALARRAREEVERTQSEIRCACAELAILVGGGRVEPAQVLWRQSMLDHLRRRLEGASRRALELEARAETLRAAWQERQRALEGLQRLEQRRRGEHALAEERRANAQLDEVAQRRAREQRLKEAAPALPHPAPPPLSTPRRTPERD